MVRADKRKFHFIYKITRINSDKYYIGMHSTDNMDDGYFGSGRMLWLSINKYGKENHTMEILEFCESREKLKIREKEIIGDLWKLDEACMNLKGGGDGGFVSFDASSRGGFSRWKDVPRKVKISRSRSDAQRDRWEKDYETLLTFSMKGLEAAKTAPAIEKRKKTFEERSHQQGDKNSQYGTMWIFNQVSGHCRKINKNDMIPEGWKKGRK